LVVGQVGWVRHPCHGTQDKQNRPEAPTLLFGHALRGSGSVSHALAQEHSYQEFHKFEAKQLADANQSRELDNLLEETDRVKKALPEPKVDPKEKKKRRKK
jgi:hypothetical protein